MRPVQDEEDPLGSRESSSLFRSYPSVLVLKPVSRPLWGYTVRVRDWEVL